jgi:endonuclease YncB( thermonuclease family)
VIFARSAFAALVLAAMSGAAAAQPVHSIDWDDADSGTVNGVDFRLADVDAPETGGVGSRNGARCKEERELGFQAKAWLADFLVGKSLVITGRDPKLDDYGRVVMSLSVDGKDLGELGLAAGRYKPHVFENGRAKGKKPRWCP